MDSDPLIPYLSLMSEIGKTHRLRALVELDFGVYFDGGSLGKILLPASENPRSYKPGEEEDIFIFKDSDDRLIGTTRKPFAEVGEFALLEIDAVNDIGAFLKWGLPKDLFVPFREQKHRLMAGESYIVRVYLDEATNRLAASTRLNRFLNLEPPEQKPWDPAEILVVDKVDIGYRVIVDNGWWGMIYDSEIFQPVARGQKIAAFVSAVREDGRLDMILHKPGYSKVDDIATNILEVLAGHGGYIKVSDKSAPKAIYDIFGVSKKSFKKAIGALYKKRLIVIETEGIRSVAPNPGGTE